MGRLVRQCIEDEAMKSYVFSEEMMPELLLLGTLEHTEIATDGGKILAVDTIHYEGKQYIIKQVFKGRWFDRR